MTLVTALVLHTCFLSADFELYKPQVRVVEQKADVEPGATPARLRASITFENKLSVAVTAVRLGFLIADSQEAFAGVHPMTVYENGPGDLPVRPVQKDIAVNLPANGLVTVSIPVDLPPGAKPGKFLTHVLAYTLGDISADTLFFLLNSTASADQVAACSALGLTGNPNERDVARQRWSSKPHLREDLLVVLEAPKPDAPSQTDTFARVYAALALGVLGGPEANRALRHMADDPNLEDFDGPMQVLERARQAGSPLQTPLAFAVPAGTQHFDQVIRAALDEADSGGLAAIVQRPHVLVALAMLSAVATLLVVRRARRLPGPTHTPKNT